MDFVWIQIVSLLIQRLFHVILSPEADWSHPGKAIAALQTVKLWDNSCTAEHANYCSEFKPVHLESCSSSYLSCVHSVCLAMDEVCFIFHSRSRLNFRSSAGCGVRSLAAPKWQTSSLLWAGMSRPQPLLQAAAALERSGAPLCHPSQDRVHAGTTAQDKTSECWGCELVWLCRARHRFVDFLQWGDSGWLTKRAHAWGQGTGMSVGMPPGSSVVDLMADFLYKVPASCSHLTHHPAKNKAVKAFLFQASYSCERKTWNSYMLRRKDKNGSYRNTNNF